MFRLILYRLCFMSSCSPRVMTLILHSSSRNYCSVSKNVLQVSWENRVKMWMRWYEDIFGLTKLAEMHEKVLQAQNRVQEIQGKRRKIQEDILTVQHQLQEVQTKLEKISRGDDMFISVVTQEHELIKEQKRLQNLLAVYDRTEREEQTSLALAINNSQDHERTYREKNKYLSLITGVVGGLIGLIGSSINNWRHRKDIKVFAHDISNLIKEQNVTSQKQDNSYSDVINDLSKNLEHFNRLLSPKDDVVSGFKNLENKTQELLSLMKTQDEAIAEIIQNIHSFIKYGKLEDGENSENFYSEIFKRKLMDEIDQKIETKIKSHTFATAGFLYSTLALTAFVIYIFNNH